MKKILLISIIGLFTFSSCDFFKSKNLFSDNSEDTLLLQMKQDSVKYVDSIRSLQNELSQLKMSHQKLLDSIKKQQKAEKTSYKYHIIVGAFRNQEYLNSFNQFIQDKGFKTQILENEFGFKMISADSYKSWKEATQALENIKVEVEQWETWEKGQNPWIYIKG